MIKYLEFASLITGSIAVLTLFYASLVYPDPTWDEETKPENPTQAYATHL